MMKNKKLPNLSELSEDEKMELFSVEELEGRLETAWNEVCTSTNSDCTTTNDGCGTTIEEPDQN